MKLHLETQKPNGATIHSRDTLKGTINLDIYSVQHSYDEATTFRELRKSDTGLYSRTLEMVLQAKTDFGYSIPNINI